MKYNIEISKILDKHLPAKGVGTERELLRMNIHRDMTDLINKLTIPVVVDSKQFTETDLLNGYQAGCIEGFDDCCDLGLNDLKEIKEDGEKWVKRYTE